MGALCDPLPNELSEQEYNELTGHGLTGRLRIEIPEPKAVSYRQINLDPDDAREICSRLKYIMLAGNVPPASMISDEPTDVPFICVAFNHETKEIEWSVAGLTTWDLCKALDDVVMAYNVQLYARDIIDVVLPPEGDHV